MDIDDLLYVINHWGLMCPSFEYTNVGSITSVEDCMDAASEYFDAYTDDWDDFVNKCVAGLCAQRIIDCD